MSTCHRYRVSGIILTVRTLKQIDALDATSYLSIPEAARELGITTQTIRNMLYYGTWITYKFKSLTVISRADVTAWKRKQEAAS